jgi:two-component system sensor histidine kinase CiaH
LRRGLRGRFGRRELLGALKVALATTAFIAVGYAALVVALDFVVAVHLTGQVDRQLAARLEVAKASPKRAFTSPGIQVSGRYGLGIYGEPIALWQFSSSGQLVKEAPNDPVLPAGTRPPGLEHPSSFNKSVDNTTYRLYWLPIRGGWLLAGESLTELGHVEAVLAVSEAVALPFLLALFFLVALVIGLRSARPVELARRRQLEFTADASHELRTPLSVIEAEVSLAKRRSRSTEEYEKVLDQVAAESGRLRSIVEDLLWLARLDAEPARPASEPVDLAVLSEGAARRFAALAEARDQRIELSGETASGPVVLAPAEWLEKLLGTLLDNACRYGRPGGRIRLSALSQQGRRRAVLRVEDDGPGISEKARGELVGRFRRASDTPGGHGLGLAIADSVARETGGQLRIDSSSLGGALVEVAWPVSRQAPLDQEPKAPRR